MRDGYFTVSEGALIALDLHKAGRNVTLRLAGPHSGPVRYVGDSERAAGKTATVDVEVASGLAFDDIVRERERLRNLGFECEPDSCGAMKVLGRTAP